MKDCCWLVPLDITCCTFLSIPWKIFEWLVQLDFLFIFEENLSNEIRLNVKEISIEQMVVNGLYIWAPSYWSPNFETIEIHKVCQILAVFKKKCFKTRKSLAIIIIKLFPSKQAIGNAILQNGQFKRNCTPMTLFTSYNQISERKRDIETQNG